ncbi:MAG: hypothetical protein MUF49_08425 [Oculatellaceae cyanobacterium Prado106]|jgi:hypothetical protein|nr:hypothetical protein [Oculatellaceae cyanobacterium Prado106]
MTYRDQLYPWCIIRLFPDSRSTIVARFRRRLDAEAHLKLLQELTPSATYQVVFEPTTRSSDAAEEGTEGEE